MIAIASLAQAYACLALQGGCARDARTPGTGDNGEQAHAPLVSRSASTGLTWQELRELITTEPEAEARAALVQKLGLESGPEAVPFLHQLLRDDPSSVVALAAADAIRRASLGPIAKELEKRVAAGNAAETSQILDTAERYLFMARGHAIPRFVRTPPAPLPVIPDTVKRVRLLAFGDFGDGSVRQAKTAAAMRREHARQRFDLAFTTGDNFYPEGVTTPDSSRFARDFADHYEAMGIPIFAALGNHDWLSLDGPAAEVLHTPRSRTWRMPALYYTFTAGPVQLFAIDTMSLGQAQLHWLQSALSQSTARWKLVFGHHSIASVGQHGDTPGLREALMPILSGRAHIYVCGHEHDLEHLAPEGGVHLLVTGGGGASPRRVSPDNRTLFAHSGNGFLVLEASDSNLEGSFWSDSGQRLYQFGIE